MIKRLSTKIVLLSFSIVGIGSVLSLFIISQLEDVSQKNIFRAETAIQEEFDADIRSQVEQACTMLATLEKRVETHEFSLAEAREAGADLLRNLRYGPGGYLWADTVEGVNVVLYGNSQVEGKSRWNDRDSQGKLLIQEIIRNGLKPGGGYSEYWYPRMGSKTPEAKRSYSLLFKPFGWVIGTGYYRADIEKTLVRYETGATRDFFETVIVSVVLFGLASLLSLGFAWFVGKKIEGSLRESEERIRTLLVEKELLLKEVHHRVKNNLSTVIGYLTLQANCLEDKNSVAILNNSINQVYTMSLLYDKLYRADNYQSVDADEYLDLLVDEIVSSFLGGNTLQVLKTIEKVRIDSNKVQALGIILNELITNSHKYAFEGIADKRIEVNLIRQGPKVRLTVKDNGKGTKLPLDPDSGSGFGLKLVSLLCKQINATLTFTQDQGTIVVVEFEG